MRSLLTIKEPQYLVSASTEEHVATLVSLTPATVSMDSLAHTVNTSLTPAPATHASMELSAATSTPPTAAPAPRASLVTSVR